MGGWTLSTGLNNRRERSERTLASSLLLLKNWFCNERVGAYVCRNKSNFFPSNLKTFCQQSVFIEIGIKAFGDEIRTAAAERILFSKNTTSALMFWLVKYAI
jgi:hypothetical protein